MVSRERFPPMRPPLAPCFLKKARTAAGSLFAMRHLNPVRVDTSRGFRYSLHTMTVGYVRVSTEKQADLGVSLDAQTERIRAMAVVRGTQIDDVIVDAGESAKSLNRPGMIRLMKLIETGRVETVIIAKLDRLTRSVADLAELLKTFERRGVSLVSVADSLDTRSASGRLLLNIMVSVSQWEREAIGERTREALRHKQSKSERVGTVPYGYRACKDGIHVEPDASEQETIAEIGRLHGVGLTLREVSTELNRRGFRTRRGGPWRFQYVAPVVRCISACSRLTTAA